MTDKERAQRNKRNAQRRLVRALKRADAVKVEWTGTRTAEWDAYIAVQNRVVYAQQVVTNLTELLTAERPASYSCRRCGLDDSGTLVLDGDWQCDMDINGDELCNECASNALIDGTMAPSSVWAYLLAVGTPDYTVTCSSCGRELYHVDEDEDTGTDYV